MAQSDNLLHKIPSLITHHRKRKHKTTGCIPNNLINIQLGRWVNKTKTVINAAVLNVRSLTNKSFFINDYISENKLHLMFLVETWLKEEGAATLIETSPPNYKFYQSIRDNKRGGGIAVIFSNKLSCNEINLGTFTSFEYLAIKADHSLLLITLYRPPKSSPTFLSDFSTLVSAVLTNYDRIIITGDFNIHVNKSGDSNGKDLLNTLDGFGLHQYVTEATPDSTLHLADVGY